MNPSSPLRTSASRTTLSRRTFLRAAGVSLALPLLDMMRPVQAGQATPRRMLAVCNNLGLLSDRQPDGPPEASDLFFPQQAGRDYVLSPYLQHMAAHRDDFTVFSGVSHPDVDGGHPADNCFLTAAPHPSSGGFRNTISLDQLAAQQIGNLTRFPTLTLGVNIQRGQRSLSWTANGSLIPCEESPAAVFRKLFVNGSPKEVERQLRQLEEGRSIMDAVAGQIKTLQQDAGARDRERLDQYFTGVRDLETRLNDAREWERKPKPFTQARLPVDPLSPRQYMDKVRLMYDMAVLAFETDSTRLITLLLDSVNSPSIDVEGTKITDGYHNLSHHGKAPDKLAQLKAIDTQHMKLLNTLFGQLKEKREGGDALLNRTMVLYGSNLGNANKHTTNNLPILLAGGGFRHGQHLAFDRERNYPLPNLYVSMLQRLGIETDRFATSTGTMLGLELA